MPMVRDAAAVRATVPRELEVYVQETGRLRDGLSDAVLRAARQYHPGRHGRFMPQAVRPAARISAAKIGRAAPLWQLPCPVRPQGKRQVPRRQGQALEQPEVLMRAVKSTDEKLEHETRSFVPVVGRAVVRGPALRPTRFAFAEGFLADLHGLGTDHVSFGVRPYGDRRNGRLVAGRQGRGSHRRQFAGGLCGRDRISIRHGANRPAHRPRGRNSGRHLLVAVGGKRQGLERPRRAKQPTNSATSRVKPTSQSDLPLQAGDAAGGGKAARRVWR